MGRHFKETLKRPDPEEAATIEDMGFTIEMKRGRTTRNSRGHQADERQQGTRRGQDHGRHAEGRPQHKCQDPWEIVQQCVGGRESSRNMEEGHHREALQKRRSLGMRQLETNQPTLCSREDLPRPFTTHETSHRQNRQRRARRGQKWERLHRSGLCTSNHSRTEFFSLCQLHPLKLPKGFRSLWIPTSIGLSVMSLLETATLPTILHCFHDDDDDRDDNDDNDDVEMGEKGTS